MKSPKIARPLLALAIWLLIVTAGSAVVWLGISRAGDEVASGPGVVVGESTSQSTSTPPATGSPARSPKSSPGHSRSPSVGRSATAAEPPATSADTQDNTQDSTQGNTQGTQDPPAPVGVASKAPAPAPTKAPSQAKPAHPPAPQPAPTQPAQPRPLEATWRGAAGFVTIVCTGSNASFRSASPAIGWRPEVRGTGPGEVSVRFERVDGDGGEAQDESFARADPVTGSMKSDEVEVTGRCVNGKAQFSTHFDD